VLGLGEDVLGVGELPSVHRVRMLDVSLSLLVLLFPAAEDHDGLVDLLGRVGFKEDFLDVDLVANFLANFVGDGLEDEFKFVVVLVDVSGDSPDELKSVQERRQGLLNDVEGVAEVTELTVQSLQEFDKVLSFGVLLGEFLKGLFKVV